VKRKHGEIQADVALSWWKNVKFGAALHAHPTKTIASCRTLEPAVANLNQNYPQARTLKYSMKIQKAGTACPR